MNTEPEIQSRSRHSIVIVDDHPIVRERLIEVINRESDLWVCGEASNRSEALQLIRETLSDLAIVDLTLKNSHGLDLIKDLKSSVPSTRILVVSMQEESLYAERCIRAGAHGYITKQEATRSILSAIRTVLDSGIYLSSTMSTNIAAGLLGKPNSKTSATVESLADRELQVFELIGTGMSTKEIAEKLRLDVKTIETYRARIKDKLNLRDGAELLHKAFLWKHKNA